MRRSEINRILADGDAFIRAQGFHLPPFAYWSPEQWRSQGAQAREIVERQLGWDITDFGSDEYRRVGLFLFTLRNGRLDDLRAGRGKVYAEKIMISDVDQVTPMHFHWAKTEDIINRGGGRLGMRLHAATDDDRLGTAPVDVSMDGVTRRIESGATLTLEPGESITFPPRVYHTFWGVDSRVLIGEVSTVNDDNVDNRFLEPAGRFPEIEEDEPPKYLLVSDYSEYYRPQS